MPLSIHGTNGITFNDGSIQASRAAVGFRNRVINGDLRVDQRNAGASQTFTAAAALAYCVVATNNNQPNPPAPSCQSLSTTGFIAVVGAGTPNFFYIAIGK